MLLLLGHQGKIELRRDYLKVIKMKRIKDHVRHVTRTLKVQILLGSPPHTSQKRAKFISLSMLTERYSVVAFRAPLGEGKGCGAFRLTSTSFFTNLRQGPFVIGASHKRMVRALTLLSTLGANQVHSTIVSA